MLFSKDDELSTLDVFPGWVGLRVAHRCFYVELTGTSWTKPTCLLSLLVAVDRRRMALLATGSRLSCCRIGWDMELPWKSLAVPLVTLLLVLVLEEGSGSSSRLLILPQEDLKGSYEYNGGVSVL